MFINYIQGYRNDYMISAESAVIKISGMNMEVEFDPQTKQITLISLKYTDFAIQGRPTSRLFHRTELLQTYFKYVFGYHFG